MVELRRRLYRVTQIRWVDVPKRAVAALRLPPAEKTGVNALLRFNGDLDRVTLLPGKRGCYKLAFKVELLRAAGVDAGDEISFTLEPDTATREPDLPEEMRKAFLARPQLAARWAAHTVALRRQIVRYIEQARSPEARARRCWIFIERLADTGRLTLG
ncbi:MAG: YdeI/OmpD-associated family protein [Opitutae bacterium]|nr:YdeI/OmpD-associated family protein [Opitutae bacterium]